MRIAATGLSGRKVLPGTGGSAWWENANFQIMNRATPRFLTPERYHTATQIIYCPGDVEGYGGATDMAASFEAMHEELRELMHDIKWPPTGTGVFRRQAHPAGIALQPGMRYRTTRSVPMWGIDSRGFTLQGNGGVIVADYAGGKAVVDMIGSSGWNVNDLTVESSNLAIPDIMILVGTPDGDIQAVDMKFQNCWIEGWANKAGLWNYGAEVFSWIGGEIMVRAQTNRAPDAVLIDCKNEHDISLYSNNDEITATVGHVVSTITHKFANCTLRTQSNGTPPRVNGAVTVNGTTDGGVLTAHSIDLDQVYMVNTRLDHTVAHPAILLRGDCPDINYVGHAELCSHQVYFDKSIGNHTHAGLKISLAREMSEVAVLGASADAYYVNIIGLDLRISSATSTFPKTLFGANMTQSVVTGSIYHALGTSDYFNFDDISSFRGSYQSPLDAASFGFLSAGSRVDILTNSPTATVRGGRKLAYKTISANGALAVEDLDVIRLAGGALTAISSISNGNRFCFRFTIVNDQAVTCAITGCEGGAFNLLAGASIVITQYFGKFFRTA